MLQEQIVFGMVFLKNVRPCALQGRLFAERSVFHLTGFGGQEAVDFGVGGVVIRYNKFRKLKSS